MRGEITKQLRERLDGLGVKWCASQVDPVTRTIISGADYHIVIDEIWRDSRRIGRLVVQTTSVDGVTQSRALEMIWPLICNEVY